MALSCRYTRRQRTRPTRTAWATGGPHAGRAGRCDPGTPGCRHRADTAALRAGRTVACHRQRSRWLRCRPVNQPAGATSVDVASMPWAMTQNEPLDVDEFIKEARKRGFHLRPATLRELYRHRLLIPFLQITGRPVRKPPKQDTTESPFGGTRITDLRVARDTGRLRDPAATPYQQRLSFEPTKRTWPTNSPWTGLLYSPYQLLALPELEATLERQTFHKRGERIIARIPKPSKSLLDRMEQFRKLAIVLTAAEPRYLPNLDREFIQLSNVPDIADWEEYRARFDPAQTQTWLSYPSAQMSQDAQFLLLMRAHRLDPVGDGWSQLMRRAPAKSRKYLKDAALIAMDDRIAAEILLRFYEDLALRGHAEPLPDLSGAMGWHPLQERLSNRQNTLDEALTDLGVSPYPRVVLALEGETEVYHAPLVWHALGYSSAPELIRILKLGGVGRNLQKVAALNVAPLVGRQVMGPRGTAWTVTRPPAYLLLAIDPDEPFNTPEGREKERTKLLREIKDVLKDQGVERPDPDELDHLIEIRVWDAPCYEFAHFTDEELADGITAVHPTVGGWTRDELVTALGYWRMRGSDVKRVWTSGRWDETAQRVTGRKWTPEPSKVDLAKALWPALLRKVHLAMVADDTPVPLIMQAISDAYRIAQQRRHLSFVITEVPDQASGSASGEAGTPER